MTTYPSVLTSFTNPQSTDRLNSPSHSAIEQAQNSGISAVQNFLGVEGPSSTTGTLIYDVRSPGSDGGGHVQSANKGGTGQTTFNKGDILVATSSSVLTKLAVGNDNQFLAANSSVAAGISWVANPVYKIATSTSVIGTTNNVETTLVTVNIPGSTLGTTNAVRATTYLRLVDLTSSVMARAYYGGAVSSVIIPAGGTNQQVGGTIAFTVIASTLSFQRSFLDVQLKPQDSLPKVGSVFGGFAAATSSVTSDADKTLSITLSGVFGSESDGYIIEKISGLS